MLTLQNIFHIQCKNRIQTGQDLLQFLIKPFYVINKPVYLLIEAQTLLIFPNNNVPPQVLPLPGLVHVINSLLT